jgi:hypothetical protein
MRSYAMFTERGDNAVNAIVLQAALFGKQPHEVYEDLRQLSRNDGFGEASDTAVRECVFGALGFYGE